MQGAGCRAQGGNIQGLSPTLHPTPYPLHPTPYALHPQPYTLYPTPYTPTIHPTQYTIHPTPKSLSTSLFLTRRGWFSVVHEKMPVQEVSEASSGRRATTCNTRSCDENSLQGFKDVCLENSSSQNHNRALPILSVLSSFDSTPAPRYLETPSEEQRLERFR